MPEVLILVNEPFAWNSIQRHDFKANPILNKSLNFCLSSKSSQTGQLLALVGLNCAKVTLKGAKPN